MIMQVSVILIFVAYSTLMINLYFKLKTAKALSEIEARELSEMNSLTLVERYEDAVVYLDKIVQDAIDEYSAENPNLEKEYITEEAELQIRDKIKNKTMDKISLLSWHRLEQVFKEPASILAMKIYLAVTLYVITNNEDISD